MLPLGPVARLFGRRQVAGPTPIALGSIAGRWDESRADLRLHPHCGPRWFAGIDCWSRPRHKQIELVALPLLFSLAFCLVAAAALLWPVSIAFAVVMSLLPAEPRSGAPTAATPGPTGGAARLVFN